MYPTDPRIDAFIERFPRLFRGQQPRVMSDLPPGWNELTGQLLADIDTMLDDSEAARFKVIQIKEKFAGLRVYWQLGREQTAVIDVIGQSSSQRLTAPPLKPTALFDRITARVRQAEEEASRTCQRCGNGVAATQGTGWLVTLCESCSTAPPGNAP